MEFTITIPPRSIHPWFLLLFANAAISAISITFIAHRSRGRPDWIHMPPLMFVINIPFSLVTFPRLAGPLLYYPSLVVSVGVGLVGAVAFVGECFGGWRPEEDDGEPMFGIC